MISKFNRIVTAVSLPFRSYLCMYPFFSPLRPYLGFLTSLFFVIFLSSSRICWGDVFAIYIQKTANWNMKSGVWTTYKWKFFLKRIFFPASVKLFFQVKWILRVNVFKLRKISFFVIYVWSNKLVNGFYLFFLMSFKPKKITQTRPNGALILL